jgi:hypothetical protein
MQIKNYNFGYFVNEKITQKQKVVVYCRNPLFSLPAPAMPLTEGEQPRPGRGDRQGLFAVAEVDGARAHGAEAVLVEFDARLVVAGKRNGGGLIKLKRQFLSYKRLPSTDEDGH